MDEIEAAMVTTAFDLPGYRVVRSLGVVRGIVVRSRSIVGNIGAGLQALFGGNITLYTNLCEKARADAFRLMVEHAGELGANAIIGVRYDANEVAECYRTVVQRLTHPAAMVLSRQNLPTLDRTRFAPAALCARGAYILAEAPGGKPQAILLATGSELDIAVKAWEQLTSAGVAVRLVSVPSSS